MRVPKLWRPAGWRFTGWEVDAIGSLSSDYRGVRRITGVISSCCLAPATNKSGSLHHALRYYVNIHAERDIIDRKKRVRGVSVARGGTASDRKYAVVYPR